MLGTTLTFNIVPIELHFVSPMLSRGRIPWRNTDQAVTLGLYHDNRHDKQLALGVLTAFIDVTVKLLHGFPPDVARYGPSLIGGRGSCRFGCLWLNLPAASQNDKSQGMFHTAGPFDPE
jgi:hypothetical protein